jgi:diamine N-acetyltransferase
MADTLLTVASADDIPVIRRLANEIWLAHYPDIIGMEQVNYMLERMYSESKLLEQIQSVDITFYLVTSDLEPIGFIGVKALGEGNYFIDKFYLSSQKQRKGLGSEAFQLLCGALGRVVSLQLQVNRQNFKSINFYFKLGFVIDHCFDVSIGDGYEMNDFLMKKTF